MLINGKNYDLNNIMEELSKGELNLSGKNEDLKILFDFFDTNKDKKLNNSEIQKIFSIFAQADKNNTEDGILTSKEQEFALDTFKKEAKSMGIDQKDIQKIDENALLAFFAQITNLNTKKLSNKIVNQIKGFSYFANTKEILKNINSNNVLDILDNYKTQTGNNLAQAIDDESFLNINDVKTYICKPLAEKAAEFDIEFDYKNINNINDLNVEINKIENLVRKEIKNSYYIETREEDGFTQIIESYKTKNGQIFNKIMKDKDGKILSDFERKIEKSASGTYSVSINRKSYHGNVVHEHNIAYQYTIEGIENYIIKNSRKNKFANIRELIEKEKHGVTNHEEQALIDEFNVLVRTVIDTGNDYGVDPNLIISIIHQETDFDGMNNAYANGVNGKGYMQLTGAPIRDYLGCYSANPAKNEYLYSKMLKNDKFGWEMKELLLSRGFDPDKADTSAKKERLAKDILNYLIKNKDADFNIRIGTLVLRDYQNDKYSIPGNVKDTAYNYNGHPAYQSKYSHNVDRYYRTIIGDSIPAEERVDTLYQYQVRKADDVYNA